MNDRAKHTFVRFAMIMSFVLALVIGLSIFTPFLSVPMKGSPLLLKSYETGEYTSELNVEYANISIPALITLAKYQDCCNFIMDWQMFCAMEGEVNIERYKDWTAEELTAYRAKLQQKYFEIDCWTEFYEDPNSPNALALSYAFTSWSQESDYFDNKVDGEYSINNNFAVLSMFFIIAMIAFAFLFLVFVVSFIIMIVQMIKSLIKIMKDPINTLKTDYTIPNVPLNVFRAMPPLLCFAAILGFFVELGAAVIIVVSASFALALLSGACRFMLNYDGVKLNILKCVLSVSSVVVIIVLMFNYTRIGMATTYTSIFRDSEPWAAPILIIGICTFIGAYLIANLFKAFTTRLACGEMYLRRLGSSSSGELENGKSCITRTVLLALAIIIPAAIYVGTGNEQITFEPFKMGHIIVDQNALLAICIVMSIILIILAVVYIIINHMTLPVADDSEETEKAEEQKEETTNNAVVSTDNTDLR